MSDRRSSPRKRLRQATLDELLVPKRKIMQSDQKNEKDKQQQSNKKPRHVFQKAPVVTVKKRIEQREIVAEAALKRATSTSPDAEPQPSSSNQAPPQAEQIKESPKKQTPPKPKPQAPSPNDPLSSFRQSVPKLQALVPAPDHTILIKTNTVTGTSLPEPYPSAYVDKWDSDHVRMPCSSQNLYPGGGNQLVDRWQLVQKALGPAVAGRWRSSLDIEESILSYNSRYASKWSFRGLHKYFNEEISAQACQTLLDSTLPKTAQLALQLPLLCTHPIPLLKRGMNRRLTLSQQQVASILANAFFCTFPSRNVNKKSQSNTFPRINFNGIFGNQPRSSEKLTCLLHYFRRVTDKMPNGLITFERRCLKTFPSWRQSNKKLCRLKVLSEGNIENDGEGMLQMDFANKFVGGGVLGHGCVQEEIRFLICPELIASALVTEVLDDNECLFMTGCERFSDYEGYADTFEWTNTHRDTAHRDSWHRLSTCIVALDAHPFSFLKDQFKENWMIRELNKAMVGFSHTHLTSIATGNWGCGAFGGDKQIKSLIQLMAAAEAGRDLVYFTFDDETFLNDLTQMHQLLVTKEQTVGTIFTLIVEYYETWLKDSRTREPLVNLFEYIYSQLQPITKQSDDVTPDRTQSDSDVVPETPPSLLEALEKLEQNSAVNQ